LLLLFICLFSAWLFARGHWSRSLWLRAAAFTFFFLSLLAELLRSAQIQLGLLFAVVVAGVVALAELWVVLRKNA
jgi:hypothetical protein